MPEVPVPQPPMGDAPRPPVRAIQLDNPEQQSYREQLGRILQHVGEWRNACVTAGFAETTYTSPRGHAEHGALDVVRQGGAVRTGSADNTVADSPNTDTYRMLLTFNDDTVSGSSRMFSLNHFTGSSFLQSPDTNANIQSAQFHVQEFRQQDRPSNYRLEILENTEGNKPSAVVYTVESGKLYADSQHLGELMTDEHAQRLVDVFDSVMPQANLGQPQEVKQIT